MDVSSLIQFEDDYFETKERKSAAGNVNFKPITCHPKWFFDGEEYETAEKLQHQANFCYWTKDYNKALSLYNKALENYFSNSPFMQRNLLESVARCYFQLGDLPKAQALAEKCLSLSYTVELKSSILCLLCTVYKSQGLLNLEKTTLLQIISLHPQNYRMWLQLALCFSELSKSDSTENMLLLEAACLLRISLIINTMKNTDVLPTLEIVNQRLSTLNLPDNFVAAGKKFFSHDLMEEQLAMKPKDETEPNETEGDDVISEMTDNGENFWFKWVQDFLK